MKKLLSILLLLTLAFTAGCGKSAPAETTAPPETTRAPETLPETLPAPETVPATILADRVPGILAMGSRGDRVDLAGEYDDDYLVVKLPQGYGLLERALVRPEGEAPYESWTGYARWGMAIYDNLYLTGEGQTFPTNTKVQVLEDLGTCYLVEREGLTGFADRKLVSQYPASSGGSGSGSGGSGGSGGGGGGGGADGDDIHMDAFTLIPLTMVEQQGAVTGKAEILADGSPMILGWFDRGMEVRVLKDDSVPAQWEGYLPVLVDSLTVYVDEALLRLEGQPAYEAWDGFAARNTKAYDNFLLRGEPLKAIPTNTALRVLEDLGDVYLVECKGETFYLGQKQVNENRVSTGGGSGSGGGGGGGGGGSSGPEWSPPVL